MQTSDTLTVFKSENPYSFLHFHLQDLRYYIKWSLSSPRSYKAASSSNINISYFIRLLHLANFPFPYSPKQGKIPYVMVIDFA